MEYTVFISYSHIDRAAVVPLVKLLRVVKAGIFRDEDSIEPGQLWDMVISKTIQAAEKILVFWSKNSQNSEAVKEEYSQAIELQKPVIPILLDSTPLDAPLARYQWVDLQGVVSSGYDSEESITFGPGMLNISSILQTPLRWLTNVVPGTKFEQIVPLPREMVITSLNNFLMLPKYGKLPDIVATQAIASHLQNMPKGNLREESGQPPRP